MATSTPKLFNPIRVGNITLAHRVVLAPLTRLRANREHVHGDLAVGYYGQRASNPGSLLITEATFIAAGMLPFSISGRKLTLINAEAGGMANVPGIWNDDQIRAWKRV